MSDEFENKLRKIFQLVFSLDNPETIEQLTQSNYPKWDSLTHVTLITALENEFDVFVQVGVAQQLRSYAEIRQWLYANQ